METLIRSIIIGAKLVLNFTNTTEIYHLSEGNDASFGDLVSRLPSCRKRNGQNLGVWGAGWVAERTGGAGG